MNRTDRGYFIVLEGIDGCGKSRQAARICDSLKSAGIPYVHTREPGGTPMAEAVREILITQDMDPHAQAMLFFAARMHHVEHCIAPALRDGKWVVCERYVDSTYAHQIAGVEPDRQGYIETFLDSLTRRLFDACGEDAMPDLALFYEVSEELAAQRCEQRGKLDVIEAKGLEYMREVARQFRRRSIRGISRRSVTCTAEEQERGDADQWTAAMAQRLIAQWRRERSGVAA